MALATGTDSKLQLRIKSRCNRMMMDGSRIVNDPEVLLQNWAEHFEKIATSREDKVDKFRN